jgi:hypothetical protein
MEESDRKAYCNDLKIVLERSEQCKVLVHVENKQFADYPEVDEIAKDERASVQYSTSEIIFDVLFLVVYPA